MADSDATFQVNLK